VKKQSIFNKIATIHWIFLGVSIFSTHLATADADVKAAFKKRAELYDLLYEVHTSPKLNEQQRASASRVIQGLNSAQMNQIRHQQNAKTREKLKQVDRELGQKLLKNPAVAKLIEQEAQGSKKTGAAAGKPSTPNTPMRTSDSPALRKGPTLDGSKVPRSLEFKGKEP